MDDVHDFYQYFSPVYIVLSQRLPRDEFISFHDSTSPIVFDERMKAVYVERHNNRVYVCLKSPCLDESEETNT